ncbi:hypothetical protein Plhal304r1_c058g0144601 [Plasmopara halstedii]
MKSSPKTCSFPHATILALCLSIPPCALVLVLNTHLVFSIFMSSVFITGFHVPFCSNESSSDLIAIVHRSLSLVFIA